MVIVLDGNLNQNCFVFIILETTGHASSKEKLLLTLAGLDYKL